MKILHVIAELVAKNGGPPMTLAALAQAQAARGDDVVVLSARRATSPTTLPLGRSGNLWVREVNTDALGQWPNREISATLKELIPGRDIVHIHGTWRYHFWGAAKVCLKYQVPYIVRPAGNLGTVTRRHKWYLKQPFFWLIERPLFNRAAAVHCTSQLELDELNGLGLRTRKFIVPNAIPVASSSEQTDDRALAQLCPEIQTHDKLIINVGRITWKKNLDVLLEAFIRIHARFPQWKLILAGPYEEPELAQRLKNRAAECQIGEKVLLPGIVTGGAKAALFRRASLFAQSSMHENFGISVAEAMFYGLPCAISTGVALASDVVAAGAGLSAESAADPFADILARFMADEALRGQCSRQAKALSDRYLPQRVTEELNKQYNLCIKGPASMPKVASEVSARTASPESHSGV